MAKDKIIKALKNMTPDELHLLLEASKAAPFSRLVSLGLAFTNDEDLDEVRKILKPFGLSSDDDMELFDTTRQIAAYGVMLPRAQ